MCQQCHNNNSDHFLLSKTILTLTRQPLLKAFTFFKADLRDSDEGVEQDNGAPADQRAPQDDSPIDQTHLYTIRRLIIRSENFYGRQMHDPMQRKKC